MNFVQRWVVGGVGEGRLPPPALAQGGELCSAVGEPLLKKATLKLGDSVPPVEDLHPMGPGAVIVASVGRHLRTFLCLSKVYWGHVQVGAFIGELGRTRLDTIELWRGDMLLIMSTCRHHGMSAPERAKRGVQGAFFTLLTPDPEHLLTTSPTCTTHLDRTPPPRVPWMWQ